MNQPRTRARLARLAFTVSLVALGAGLTSTPATAQTHLGVPVEDIVTLGNHSNANNDCGVSGGSFFRLREDGSRELEEFVVPAGRKFVITDIVWRAGPGVVQQQLQDWSLDTSLTFTLLFLSQAGLEVAFNAPPVPVLDEYNSERHPLGNQVQLAAGLVAGEGVQVCAFSLQQTAVFSGGVASNLGQVTIHGYLTQNQPLIAGTVSAFGPPAMAMMIFGLLFSGAIYLLRRRRPDLGV